MSLFLNPHVRQAAPRRARLATVSLCAMFAILVAGCDDPVDPQKTEPTRVLFSADAAPHGLGVYLDGALVGEVASGRPLSKEVLPGAHSYRVSDSRCGFTSRPESFSVAPSETKSIELGPGRPPIDMPVPTNLTASMTAEEYVRVSWQPVSHSVPPSYEILRNGVPIATVAGTSYEDRSAGRFTAYTYSVRARWTCGAGPSSNPSEGFRRAAGFSHERAVVENASRRIYLLADLDVWGHRGHSMAVAGYWFRKVGNSYYYQRSRCQHNTPGNYLGHVGSVTPGPDKAHYDDLGIWVHWDCFVDKSGVYYGMLKLYRSASISHPNDAEYARTAYVSITWRKTSTWAGDDDPAPEVRILTDAEVRDLALHCEKGGGIATPPAQSQAFCDGCLGSGLSDSISPAGEAGDAVLPDGPASE